MEGYKTDGWRTFSGGMRMADGARSAIGPDQAEILVNATVRRGRVEPRPAIHVEPLAFRGRRAQAIFERGQFQAAAFYDSPAGPRLVIVSDGHILSFDPESKLMRLISPNNRQVFPKLNRQAWLCQRSRWMVAQCGGSPPAIIEGDRVRIETDAYNGVPAGAMMADGWNRLVVVAADRRRIFLSDHEYDPTTNPLRFTDDATYFKNARYFEMPRALGEVRAVTFAPSFNNQDDWGPLLVFGANGTRAFQLQVPRENWVDQDIAATVLPSIGGIAQGAQVARGNDLVFSDDRGRIQTFKAAITGRDDVRLRPADQAVWPLYRSEDSRLRAHRSAVRFDDRIITTIWPESVSLANGRRPVRHRGMVVMEEDHLSERPFVWAGLWTGIFPVSLVTGAGCCWAISLDPDGVPRIHRNSTQAGPDLMPEPRRVPWWLVPRWTDHGNPFALKNVASAAIDLDRARGRVSIQGWWQTAGDQPRQWFTHEQASPDCLAFRDCGIIAEVADAGAPRFNLPAPPLDRAAHFSRPWLRFTGHAAVEQGWVLASVTAGNQDASNQCAVPTVARGELAPCEPAWWEGHSRELPIDTQLPVELCPN